MAKKRPELRTDCPYHITARTNNREWFGLDLSQVWKIYEDHLFFLHHAFSIRIHAFVLMTNHFHLLSSDPTGEIKTAMQWFMTETAKQINLQTGKINHVYGGRHFRGLIPSYHYYLHAYKYIYRNPVEVGTCQWVEQYPYSSLRGMFGFQKLVFPVSDGILPEDLEGTLKWLNKIPDVKNKQIIQKALKRPVFKLPKSRSSRKLSHLEENLY
jgi:putative transposase